MKIFFFVTLVALVAADVPAVDAVANDPAETADTDAAVPAVAEDTHADSVDGVKIEKVAADTHADSVDAVKIEKVAADTHADSVDAVKIEKVAADTHAESVDGVKIEKVAADTHVDSVDGVEIETNTKLGVKVTQYAGPTKCEKFTKLGDRVEIHYTGKIDESSLTGEKGKQFDSSRTREQGFKFIIGNGEVIKGWDEGLVNLCLGAKATLVIQPDFGYGARGAGADIPAGATLNFDIEVVYFESPPNIFENIDGHAKAKDGAKDGILTVEEIKAYFKELGHSFPKDMVEREDKNKDGKISWEEFGGPKGRIPPKHAAKTEL